MAASATGVLENASVTPQRLQRMGRICSRGTRNAFPTAHSSQRVGRIADSGAPKYLSDRCMSCLTRSISDSISHYRLCVEPHMTALTFAFA